MKINENCIIYVPNQKDSTDLASNSLKMLIDLKLIGIKKNDQHFRSRYLNLMQTIIAYFKQYHFSQIIKKTKLTGPKMFHKEKQTSL